MSEELQKTTAERGRDESSGRVEVPEMDVATSLKTVAQLVNNVEVGLTSSQPQENSDKSVKNDESGAKNEVGHSEENKDKLRKNKSRSRSRSRHRSPRRDRKRSRSREYRSRRSKSREGRRRSISRPRDRKSRSRSRDKRRKSRSPDKKRYRSRSVDKKMVSSKNGDKVRDSKSPSPGKSSRQKLHDPDSSRRRRRSRSRDKSRYDSRDYRSRRSPDNKQGTDYDRHFDDSYDRGYSKYSNKRHDDQRYPDDKFSRDNCYKNDRKNDNRQFNNNNSNSWNRDLNQSNWTDKGRYPPSNMSHTHGNFWEGENRSKQDGSQLEDAVGQSIAKIRQDFEARGPHQYPIENPTSSAIPVVLSSNCKQDDATYPVTQQGPEGGNFVKPLMASNNDARLPAPPRLAIPPPNFKGGLPNVREPPPGFLSFRPNNPMQVRLPAESAHPPFAILNHSRLPVRNTEPQQVILQPLQLIRGPTKLEIPVDLRFLNPELRLPLYSTGIINRPVAQAPQITNIMRGVHVDQTRIMHQVQSRLVGMPQVSDVPPPPPPPQTFTMTQPPTLPTNTPFGASGMPRLPENVSFITNPPPRLVFSSMTSRPGFITNLASNKALHPRIPASHPPPPPPQILLPSNHSSTVFPVISDAPLNTEMSIAVHSTESSQQAEASSRGCSANKTVKPKQKTTGSEKYSPYSCTSDGSSVDAYTDALFDDPFNDTGTPLEEESNSGSCAPKPSEDDDSVSQDTNTPQIIESESTGDINNKEPQPTKDKKTTIPSFVDLPGIPKNIDLASTLNLIQVNDLKRVLETAASNSANKAKQSGTAQEGKSSKASIVSCNSAQRMDQIAEEVKLALKPHFSKNLINKEEYKDIMRKAVPKIFGSRSSPDSSRIQAFVQEYVNKIVKSRKSGKVKNTTAHGSTHDKKQASKIPMKA